MAIKKKHAGGRPSKYLPEYVDRLYQYINCDPNHPLDLESCDTQGNTKQYQKIVPNEYCPSRDGFADLIGVTEDTLTNWGKEHVEFLGALKRLDQKQKYFLIQNGLVGQYDARFAQFVLINNHGMSSSKDNVNHSGGTDDKLNVRVSFTNYNRD